MRESHQHMPRVCVSSRCQGLHASADTFPVIGQDHGANSVVCCLAYAGFPVWTCSSNGKSARNSARAAAGMLGLARALLLRQSFVKLLLWLLPFLVLTRDPNLQRTHLLYLLLAPGSPRLLERCEAIWQKLLYLANFVASKQQKTNPYMAEERGDSEQLRASQLP